MNKVQFLEQIRKGLKGLPKEEINDIIIDFKEYFEVGAERGRKEQEIAFSLGEPKVLAKQIKAESYIKKAEESSNTLNIARAVFMTVGLSFFNLIFILPIFLLMISILAVLFAAAVSVSAAGISSTVASFFYPMYSNYLPFTVNTAALVFAFISLIALGILFFIGDLYLAKLVYRLILKYLRFNINIVKSRRQPDEKKY